MENYNKLKNNTTRHRASFRIDLSNGLSWLSNLILSSVVSYPTSKVLLPPTCRLFIHTIHKINNIILHNSAYANYYNGRQNGRALKQYFRLLSI